MNSRVGKSLSFSLFLHYIIVMGSRDLALFAAIFYEGKERESHAGSKNDKRTTALVISN